LPLKIGQVQQLESTEFSSGTYLKFQTRENSGKGGLCFALFLFKHAMTKQQYSGEDLGGF
jgi:hypothetical protein